MLNDEHQHADEPEDEQRVEEVALGAREGRHRDATETAEAAEAAVAVPSGAVG